MPRVSSRIVALFLLSACLVFGQTTTGEIFGTVTDPSGAAVPAAEITIINENTGETKIVQSGATGDYLAPLLPVGTYTATARLSGFRATERSGLGLSTVQSLRVDFTLEIGEVTETVERPSPERSVARKPDNRAVAV